MAEYEWRGVNERGDAVGGITTATPEQLCAIVEDRYERGWQSLTVWRDGDEVAGIGPGLSRPRRRTWWAETPKDGS